MASEVIFAIVKGNRSLGRPSWKARGSLPASIGRGRSTAAQGRE